MNLNKITFIANRRWLKEDSEFKPKPIIKTLPDWYRKGDRFAKFPGSNDYVIGQDKGKIPTWKACPAVFDIMGTGYTYVTPCDINFIKDKNNTIKIEIEDTNYKDFCTPRPPMPGFVTPNGYRSNHFAWFADWGVKIPDGYSIIYSNPFNRFELPFFTTSGIIDNDKVHFPGFMPFFLSSNFSGVIEKGTPFAQMIPFKRENWESEFEIPTFSQMIQKTKENSDKYRIPNGGVYKNEVWEPRKYS